MRKLPFKLSTNLSLGVEIEFQIIDSKTYLLADRAKDLIRIIENSAYNKLIKPEIIQSMIEINTSVHNTPYELLLELLEMHDFFQEQAKQLNIKFCGGGTHPFQSWTSSKIFPLLRYKKLARLYRYLAKRATVFGLHIHIGCTNENDALYLSHALTRFVPQLIALSASSPFFEGADSGYDSTRVTIFNSFPTCGVVPFITDWQEFSNYFFKIRNLGIVESMKDFYWDIRPQPKFGTVEIRVCDTPLTFKKAALLAAYLQAISHYLLSARPFEISHDLYMLYNFNRFQASRFGLAGHIIDIDSLEKKTIAEDIETTVEFIKPYAEKFNSLVFIEKLMNEMRNQKNDATWLRTMYKNGISLREIIKKQCIVWSKKPEL